MVFGSPFIYALETKKQAEPGKNEIWTANFVLSDHVLHELIFAHEAYRKSAPGKSRELLQKMAMTRAFSYWVYITSNNFPNLGNSAIESVHRHMREVIKRFNFQDQDWLYPFGLEEVIKKLDGTVELNTIMDERFLPFFPPEGIKTIGQYRDYVLKFKTWVQ
jgi:hypothetical protein